MHPAIGQIVRVRARQYLVEEVTPPDPGPRDTLVRLSCLEDDAQGEPLEVLWERELDAQLLDASSWDSVTSRGFDDPSLFSAYLNTLRWSCVTSTDPYLFQAPHRAGIEVMAYQLEPLRKALLMPRVNLFIADDVGLGKTIEAGLIVRELLMRQKLRRIVISCPPSVVLQWKEEMEQRFGLTFVIFDRAFVAARRRERGYGINPWKTHTRFIISQALLRDEAYAGPLRDWLGNFSSGSMLILDEAHNAAPASAARYAIDSKLTRIVRELAPRFEHRLFLSATPHNGHSNSFTALLEILDPQRFCRGCKADHKLLNAVMVRRLKGDLRAIGGKLKDDFPRRDVLRIEIDGLPDDAPELQLSRLLQQYRKAREQRLKDAPKGKRTTAMLVITSLQKRLLSSIEAFARTLSVHQRAFLKQLEQTEDAKEASYVDADDDNFVQQQFGLLQQAPGADDERADLSEEELEDEDDAQLAAATAASAGIETSQDDAATAQQRQIELDLLEQMSTIAQRARYQPDGRIRALVDWLRAQLCPGIASTDTPADATAPWADRRVLIFTEYTDTKRYLQQQLETAIAGTDQAAHRIASFHGGMTEEGREEIKRAFNARPDAHPLRILIATDAAREGVNLQNYCADLFHLDIPWNPSRMEQRNGRIDRKLQRESSVRCHYFVLPQRAEDRVLDVLVKKTKTIQEELGSLSPVLEQRFTKTLREGIRHEDEALITHQLQQLEDGDADVARGVATVKAELETHREADAALVKQITRLRELLSRAEKRLGLSDALFRQALSASLQMLGAPPLEKLDVHSEDLDTARWQVPALDKLSADGTWTHTLDSLRAPRKRNQKPWEWRKESPVLPIIFKDPGTLEGDVVHLHLEHRLVQRLLGRFLSQGFVHHDIARACVCMTDEPIPKILILGRLSLYGDNAARLHDEIIAVAADWVPPSMRGRGKLKPLNQGDKDTVLQLLETALTTPRLRDASPAVRETFLATVMQDVGELLPQLQRRADSLQQSALKKLATRGEKEASEMRAILEAQRQRIIDSAAEFDKPNQQLELSFSKEEAAQRRADRKYWSERLVEIEDELTTEPARVQRSYDVKAARVEPVGVVYLAPVSG